MTASPYSIRPATAEDAAEMVELMAEHAVYERDVFERDGKVERVRDCLASAPPPFQSLVVESNGRLSGYCCYFFSFDSWTCRKHVVLDAMYLRPEARGVGVGVEIMERLRAAAVEAGCDSVRWQTPLFNELGIRFYERLRASSTTKMFFTWKV